MVSEGSLPEHGREAISDARGLRRDFFRWMKYRHGWTFVPIMRRTQTVNLPHPSHRAAWRRWRTRKLPRDCEAD